MFHTILIANRGEIACRIIRTCQRLSVRTVCVFSAADRGALFTRLADVAVEIGPSPASESYLRADRIIEVAQRQGAQAVHPGYGFLAENAEFARACQAAGLRFIGPPAEAIEAMGHKHAAKTLMERAGVPVVPGYHGLDQSDERLRQEANRIGYPLLIKAVAGGGGKGMRRVAEASDFMTALSGARREALSSFGDERVLLERYLDKSRHIEVQVLADAHGHTLHLHERDCSLQRRHQKVVEEAPAPFVDGSLRAFLGELAVKAASAVDYEGAGTVELIADVTDGLAAERLYFMEMNTRLQVEHPVTELVTGLDLVEWQLRVASGERLPWTQAEIPLAGHAIEVRICAEEPASDFAPRTGKLVHVSWPESSPHVRVETGVVSGDEVSVHYDSMLAKLVVWGPDRAEAARRLSHALGLVHVAGVPTNVSFLKATIEHPAFLAGDLYTGLLADHHAELVREPDGSFARAVVFAALGQLFARAARSQATLSEDPWSPWADTRAFRINRPREDVLPLTVLGRDVDVHVGFEADLTHLSFDDLNVNVTRAALAGQQLSLVANGERQEARYVVTGARAFLLFDGQSVEVRLRPLFVASAEDAASLGNVVSPLPGRILSVFVEVGQRVAKGEPLVSLEAMKMEHVLKASAQGVVRSLHVKAQEQVVEGSTLLVLGDPDAAEE